VEAVLSRSRQATLLWYQLPNVSLGLRFTEPPDELGVFLVVPVDCVPLCALPIPSGPRPKCYLVVSHCKVKEVCCDWCCVWVEKFVKTRKNLLTERKILD
jgi:hypothetical protein